MKIEEIKKDINNEVWIEIELLKNSLIDKCLKNGFEMNKLFVFNLILRKKWNVWIWIFSFSKKDEIQQISIKINIQLFIIKVFERF